jgi:hypothetical protein
MAVVMPYGYDKEGNKKEMADTPNSVWGNRQPFVMSYNSTTSVSEWTKEIEKYVYLEPLTWHFDDSIHNYVRYYYYKKK